MTDVINYRKVASSNTSRLEAHAGFFRLLMKGIIDPYVLWLFDKKYVPLINQKVCGFKSWDSELTYSFLRLRNVNKTTFQLKTFFRYSAKVTFWFLIIFLL